MENTTLTNINIIFLFVGMAYGHVVERTCGLPQESVAVGQAFLFFDLLVLFIGLHFVLMVLFLIMGHPDFGLRLVGLQIFQINKITLKNSYYAMVISLLDESLLFISSSLAISRFVGHPVSLSNGCLI